MPSRYLLDPEVAPVLELFPALDFSAKTLPGLRSEVLGLFVANTPPLPSHIERSERFAPGLHGAPDVRMLVYAPKKSGANRPVLLHIHGGGYILGAAEIAETPSVMRATELDAVVVAVDYRLAPETPYPGAVEDCYAALSWIFENSADLGVDRNRIGISGESAGGGLAAALALLARDRKKMPIAFQHLTYPMLDDRTVTQSDPSPYVGQFMWAREANAFGWSTLLGAAPGGPDVSLYAAAARAEDLSGLPQTFLFCGAIDLFVEESLEYGRRLIRAGVPTEMHIYPGAPHAFELMASAAVAKRYMVDSLSAMRRGFGMTAEEV